MPKVLPAEIVESISNATSLTRETVRSVFSDLQQALGPRISRMQARVGAIMANTSGTDAQFEAVTSYTDEVVTTDEKARLWGALGVGFIGGYLLAAAAGEVIVILAGLALLLLAGFLVQDMLRHMIDRLKASLDRFSL